MKPQEGLSESWKTAIRRTLVCSGIATVLFSGATSDYQFSQADKAAPDSAEQVTATQNGRLALGALAGGVLLISVGLKSRALKPKDEPKP
jgi:hypothetical protein